MIPEQINEFFKLLKQELMKEVSDEYADLIIQTSFLIEKLNEDPDYVEHDSVEEWSKILMDAFHLNEI